jgi:hypothetical protein
VCSIILVNIKNLLPNELKNVGITNEKYLCEKNENLIVYIIIQKMKKLVQKVDCTESPELNKYKNEQKKSKRMQLYSVFWIIGIVLMTFWFIMNNYLQQAEATETKLGYYQDKYKYHEAMEKIIKIIDEKRTERDALNDIINQEKAKLEVIATEWWLVVPPWYRME